MIRFLTRLILAAALVAVVPACSTSGQPVVPRALTASYSLSASDPNPALFVSNRGHELELITAPNGTLALRIHGRMRDEATGLQVGEIDINVTSGVTLGPATYGPSQGSATIVVQGLDGTWWSSALNSLHLEVTQLDVARNQASGTFRFRAKREAGETEVLHVMDGAFLFLEIDDNR